MGNSDSDLLKNYRVVFEWKRGKLYRHVYSDNDWIWEQQNFYDSKPTLLPVTVTIIPESFPKSSDIILEESPGKFIEITSTISSRYISGISEYIITHNGQSFSKYVKCTANN